MLTPDIIHYLQKTVIPVRLSCITASGWPVVLSLWYIYHDDAIYCATQRSAKVVSYLRAERRCAFEIAADMPPYCGVRGRAKALLQPEHGAEILDKLLQRYLGGLDSPLARELRQRADNEVTLRLVPQSVYTWNFSKRMADSLSHQPHKVCPEG